jgi:CelD/BcsL family acetyltransferase involved in cellulose biosynthesis
MAIAPGGELITHREAAPAAAPAVRFLASAEAVPGLKAEWDALAGAAAEPNSFAESWFVSASLRHLARSEVRLAEVRSAGRLVGLMPLLVEPRYGRVPVRYVQNWRHHHLFLGTPLVRAGFEQSFWRALVGALDAADWAPNFLHIRDLTEGGALHRGLNQAGEALGRPVDVVHREVRAFLESDLSPTQYYEAAVRKKKRKELARLRNRLAEIGPLATRSFGPGDDLTSWCDDFLRLERAGWKGECGSALACRPATEAFFREALLGAHRAGRLQFLRMTLGERPIAMLVNFLSPPGSFSFKTAFDEDYARFSPGVLLQIDNLAILHRPEIGWMDSCAVEQHPMIDSLWRERRSIVRVTVPLSGLRRRLAYTAARGLEQASATLRRRKQKPVQDSAE